MRTRLRHRQGSVVFLAVLLVLPLVSSIHLASAQVVGDPERDRYISSVPLSYPKVTRQTDPSAALYLFGNTKAPGYRDTAPVDGIDDDRHAVLEALAVRFAPYMVQQTSALPMDFMKFAEESASFPIQVDTWDIAGPGELVQSEFIDLKALGGIPCPAALAHDALQVPLPGDCHLQALIDEFAPNQPQNEWASTLAYDFKEKLFKVLFIDYPGYDEETWKAAYEDPFTQQLRVTYHGYPKVYAHPFIRETNPLQEKTSGAKATDSEAPGYELVMQFWMFYPFNDGGNNHEGDWEHINVVIAPKNEVTRPQSAATIERMLAGDLLNQNDASDELVIKRVEYYFHHYVIMLDYAHPNVYAPHPVWQTQKDRIVKEEMGIEWVWDEVRHRAYWDDSESKINTHPIAYVGADNKGWDQLLASPGGRNRDSHGSYPFTGLYRSIGTAGASEQITAHFDHRAYYRDYLATGKEPPTDFSQGHVYPYDAPDKVQIVPDWERVTGLMDTSATARRDWWWLTLPVYFGYPRADSPFSSVVANADLGNLSVHGPTFNTGWNRSGPTSSYDLYKPHRFPSLFPLGFQDNIRNNLGWINAPFFVTGLPPFDVAFQLATAPVRALKKQDPVFYDTETLPYRFVSFSGGLTTQRLPRAFTNLLINKQQFPEFLDAIGHHVLESGGNTTTALLDGTSAVETSAGPMARVFFTLGGRLVTDNTVRHIRAPSSLRLTFSDVDPLVFRSDLNLWEYAGSVRYGLSLGSFQPYVKGGYGFSWFRMENLTANGQPLNNANSPWQSWKWTWHAGLGVEVPLFRSLAPLPHGIDMSVRAEVGWYNHSLGLRTKDLPLAAYIGAGFPPDTLPQEQRVTRTDGSVGLVVSF